jgi:DNA processing protein
VPSPPPHVHLTPLAPGYPSRLRSDAKAPASLVTRGGSLEADRVVAVVGSREAAPDAARFARDLAARLAGLGAVVVSGGALGIDGAAHRGALDAGGRTWVVAPTGCDHVFPPEHAGLFDEVARGPGAMVWPFAPDYRERSGFLVRNRVLVALADAVVVVQAGFPSGALRAATCARNLGKPLWVCPAPPWLEAYRGSRMLLARADDVPGSGARPLFFVEALLASLGLPGGGPSGATSAGGVEPVPSRALSSSEADALRGTSTTPLHLDEIASRAGIPARAAASALLTLALENVVVEGPPGFFRRHNGR